MISNLFFMFRSVIFFNSKLFALDVASLLFLFKRSHICALKH